MDAYYASMDLLGEGRVSWASDGPVPAWFDVAQDLTERWVHQMQIREAVDRVEDYQAAYLPTVLRTFVWALPISTASRPREAPPSRSTCRPAGSGASRASATPDGRCAKALPMTPTPGLGTATTRAGAG